MEYTLRTGNKTKYILLAAVSFIVMLVGIWLLVDNISSGLVTMEDILGLVIIPLGCVGIGIYGLAINLGSLIKKLHFGDEGFTVRGAFYTYQQIDCVRLHGGRYGAVYYTVFVNGKSVFIFEGTDIGADKILDYLKQHEVLIEHFHMV